MRPRLTMLSEAQVEAIIDRAMTVLEKVGMHIGSPRVTDIVGAREGARVEGDRVFMGRGLVEASLATAPAEIRAYSQDAGAPLVLAGENVHFVAGSVSQSVHDDETGTIREATSQDLVNHIRVLNHCPHIDFQSGAYVVNDVPKAVTGAWRHYLSLVHSPKPMFGGAFGEDDLGVILAMNAVVAGGERELAERPLLVVPTNPSSPLGLTPITSGHIAACAEHLVPIMVVSIALAGGSSPATIAGTLVEGTAEFLGCCVVSQSVRAGAPIIYGGGPSILDMQSGAACQASTESVVMGAATAQIARRLKVPSATNTGRADSKRVDYQAGEESGIAFSAMALAGVNMIRGPGDMEYGNVVSKAKLLIDNELCGMAKRLARPVETSEDALALDIILERGVGTRGFLSSAHTMRWFRSEFFFPTRIIDRVSRRQYEAGGSLDACGRAHARVREILAEPTARAMDPAKKAEITRIMKAFAKRHGMERLPVGEDG